MKILDSDNPLADAVAYAKSSQHQGQSVVLSFARGMVIVTHDNGHKRAYRKPDGVIIMNRLLASIETEGCSSRRREADDARS